VRRVSPVEGIGDRFQLETKYEREGGPGVSPLTLSRPGRQVTLPPPAKTAGAGLWDAIAARRSLRDFRRSEPITPAELSQLLWATQGLTGSPSDTWFRAAPSAGALHPLDTYLVLNRVSELPAGIARYDVPSGSIHLLAEGDFSEEIAAAALEQQMAAEAAVVFVWVAVPGRSKPRYRQRAYRYMYLDAGHIGGQLHLAAVALGLGCCAIGAFLDDEVNALLELDGVEETAAYLSVVGRV